MGLKYINKYPGTYGMYLFAQKYTEYLQYFHHCTYLPVKKFEGLDLSNFLVAMIFDMCNVNSIFQFLD